MKYALKNSIDIYTALLTKKYSDKQHIQAIIWWVIESVTKKTKLELITSQNTLTPDQADEIFASIIKHVEDDYPLQYILKTVPFCGLTLCVEPPTLIPRPETEEWVTHLIEQLQPLVHEPLAILDMCTGSGCIGLALAQALPQAHIYAVDSANTALALTQKNAHLNRIDNITIVSSNLYQNLPTNIQFDLIVSNPPYISEAEFKDLSPTVAKWEDKQALVADDDGLYLIKKIISDAPTYLKKEIKLSSLNIPQIVIEIGYLQGSTVQKLCSNAGFDTITVVQDLYGKDRIVTCLGNAHL